MRYSIFAINLIDIHEHNLYMICICFRIGLDIRLSNDIWLALINSFFNLLISDSIWKKKKKNGNPQNGVGKSGLTPDHFLHHVRKTFM